MMLSSDKNVETIGQLVQAVGRYLTLQKECVKFDVAEKLVQVLTVAALVAVGFLLAVAVLLYLSFAVAYWLAESMGLPTAFLLVSLAHLVLLIVVFVFRKQWIERPLVKLLANLLTDNHPQEELAQTRDEISGHWQQLVTPQKANTRRELVSALVANSITAFDAFLLVRKLMRGYRTLFRRKRH